MKWKKKCKRQLLAGVCQSACGHLRILRGGGERNSKMAATRKTLSTSGPIDARYEGKLHFFHIKQSLFDLSQP